MPEKPELWVIDDSDEERRKILELLRSIGASATYALREARDRCEVRSLLRGLQSPDQVAGVILDLFFQSQQKCETKDPSTEGLKILGDLKAAGLQCPVLLFSNFLSETARNQALQLYYPDLVTSREKDTPWNVAIPRFLGKIRDVQDKPNLFREYAKVGFISEDPRMLLVLEKAEEIVKEVRRGTSFVKVLITGETGVGKEQLARAIHLRAFGEETSFSTWLSSPINEEILWAQLVGARAGTWTGLRERLPGLLSTSKTVLLDEIGDLPEPLQKQLLHLADTGKYHPYGYKEREFHGLLIFATNKNLDELVSQGKFKNDLYFRLISSYHIHIPPLRERPKDIWALLKWKMGTPLRFTQQAQRALEGHSWPGNVRALLGFAENLKRLVQTNETSVVDLGMVLEAFGSQLGITKREPSHRLEVDIHTVKDILEHLLLWMDKRRVTFKDLVYLLILQAKEDKKRDPIVRLENLGISRATYYRYTKDMQQKSIVRLKALRDDEIHFFRKTLKSGSGQ